MYNKIGLGAPPPNTNIGGFSNFAYWSSSQSNADDAIHGQFGNGTTAGWIKKDSELYMRAIRRF